ncbi:GGDEF domain-containing protein [Noviherbaspirillum aridicola]|uniref:diguanylate cyclase n=1 Tax=Noviherbaspirillum aridicola TaxID=2849687 RepID=A0ABQ4PZV0_9BURK|nr:GGDEF domain-containing protein [Noviherbaspirillum aridicola]
MPGTRELIASAALGVAANLLYAFGRHLPPLLAYELANGVYAAATGAAFIGYRLLFGRKPCASAVAIAVAFFTAGIAYFHYLVDSHLARSALVALFQAGVCAGIATTLLQARREWRKPYYTKLFVLAVCGLIAAGHLARVAWLWAAPDAPTSLLEPNLWSVAFLSAFCFALPGLVFGGLLLVHRRIVAMAEEAANRDFLTEAWSRRAFFETSRREMARALRTGRPLALMLIDFDNFKPINDTLGHDAGDRALVAFARRALSALRETDCLARMGGDEFAVLMPETDLKRAMLVATRLKSEVETTTRQDDFLRGVTLSIGVSQYTANDTPEVVLKRADVALYKAKAAGRNRIVCVPVEHDRDRLRQVV